MTTAQAEWYTVILPFVGTPIAILVFIFFYWVFPSWIGSFNEEQ